MSQVQISTVKGLGYVWVEEINCNGLHLVLIHSYPYVFTCSECFRAPEWITKPTIVRGKIGREGTGPELAQNIHSHVTIR